MRSSQALALQGFGGGGGGNLRISGIFFFVLLRDRGRALCRGPRQWLPASAPRSSSPSSPKAGEEGMGQGKAAFPTAPAGSGGAARRGLYG